MIWLVVRLRQGHDVQGLPLALLIVRLLVEPVGLLGKPQISAEPPLQTAVNQVR